MPWILRPKEIEAVLLLEAPERYQYLIKRVADEEQIWSLQHDDGWALFRDDAGREMVPVWPHKTYASLCATGVFFGYNSERISLDTWMQRRLPSIANDGLLIAAFPAPNNAGLAVEPRRMQADLEEELSQY